MAPIHETVPGLSANVPTTNPTPTQASITIPTRVHVIVFFPFFQRFNTLGRVSDFLFHRQQEAHPWAEYFHFESLSSGSGQLGLFFGTRALVRPPMWHPRRNMNPPSGT